MYHSKVVIICWATIYLIAAITAILKRRWIGLRFILIGSLIVAAGITASALLNNTVGALMLSAALLVATYYTLMGIVKTLSKS